MKDNTRQIDQFILGSLDSLSVYTDGACSLNPGAGGWGAIFVAKNNDTFSISGCHPHTTNNRMEMMAVINALKAIDSFDVKLVHVYTDSMYVKNGITVWSKKWMKNNWRTSDNKSVKNQELWLELLDLSLRKNIEWHWVKGHSDNIFNNKVDLLAREALQQHTDKD